MKILKFYDTASWLQARIGKITGSIAYDISPKERGSGYRKGFYEMIADKLALPSAEEDPLARGHRLEPEAVAILSQRTGKTYDTSLVLWTREDDESIAVSPDAYEEVDFKVNEAVEVKCLGGATHIEIMLTKEVPKEYQFQVRQYFLVNEDLKKLTLCFYNPDLRAGKFFTIEYKREDVQAEVDATLEHQRNTIKEIDRIVESILAQE